MRNNIILSIILLITAVFLLTGCGQAAEPLEYTGEPVASNYFAPSGPPPFEYEENGQEPEDININPHEELAQFVDALLTTNNFSGAILIRQGDDIIISQAYGMANRAENIENTIHTPFAIASLTKHFTGAAILQLEEKGKLDMATTLDNFFPGHDDLENVTVAHLLAMRGDFGDRTHYVNELISSEENFLPFLEGLIASLPEEEYRLFSARLADSPGDPFSVLLEFSESEAVRAFSIDHLENQILTSWNWDPRSLYRFRYSNSAYWLLGRIIEQVSEMKFEEYVAMNLFAPAAMENSGFEGIHDTANYYDTRGNTVLNMSIFARGYSSGGLISTVYDLNLWLDAYFGGILFCKTMFDRTLPFIVSYNYGWNGFSSNGRWSHTGGGGNFTISYIVHNHANDTRIIILSNTISGRQINNFAGQIERHMARGN